MGQNALIDGVSYKVSAAEAYTEIGESEVSQKASGVFYVITLVTENAGIPEGYIFSPGVRLIDERGNSYDQNLKAKFYISNLIDWEKVLVTGTTHSGVLVFDVPTDAKGLKLEIRNDWRDVEKIYITIPETGVVNKGVMGAVVKAREEDELLKAGIN